MSGGAEKKAAKAGAKARRRYTMLIAAVNLCYGLLRLGWLGGASPGGLGKLGSLRWFSVLVAQAVAALFLCDAEANGTGTTAALPKKSGLGSAASSGGGKSESAFDAFAILVASQVPKTGTCYALEMYASCSYPTSPALSIAPSEHCFV